MNPAIDRQIRKGDDPVLKAVCTPIEPGEHLPWLATMERVCRLAPGVGLAAPQIAQARRVVMTLLGRESRFYINPVITWRSESTNVQREGCLSYPGIEKGIRRHDAIEMDFLDEQRRPRSERFDGFTARVIQHEVDHLDGICRVGDPAYADELPPQPVQAKRRMRPMDAAVLVALASVGMNSMRR